MRMSAQAGVGRTQTISVHKYRRVARWRERRLQRLLSDDRAAIVAGIPSWARGARVEQVKGGMYCVILTEEAGH